MKKIIVIITSLILLNAKENIAILDLEPSGISEVEARVLSERLINEIYKLNLYSIIERSALEKVIKEQNLQHSGLVDVSKAVEIGAILNVDYMVLGSVSKIGKTFSINSRMIDVEKASIKSVAGYDFKGEIDELLTSGMPKIALQLCQSKDSFEKMYAVDLGQYMDDPKRAMFLKSLNGETLNIRKSGHRSLMKYSDSRVTHSGYTRAMYVASPAWESYPNEIVEFKATVFTNSPKAKIHNKKHTSRKANYTTVKFKFVGNNNGGWVKHSP